MATNKDKLLESAQKNLKKKQVAKAIKDYAKIVELDPADVRSRQKLAELYVRTNKNTEAYEQYESIAKYFSSNGFYLKAIAIYKQMQRLDPSQVALFNRLAELNEKQGLLGNAMTEYRNLVDHYGRNGMIADEIKTLEKMRDLDLNNLNVRVKLAEVYANNDRKDEGYSELDSVLEILSERGDFDKILKLYKMFLPLYPKNNKLQMGLALAFYEKGDYGRGVQILENLLKEKPSDPDLLRLLGRGYSDLKKWAKSCEIYQQLLSMDPTDLDTRESLIQCEIDRKHFDIALTELEDWKDTFFKADRLDRLKDFYEILKGELADNRVVLQTLDSIYELTGEGDKLLDIISEQPDEPEEMIIEETLSDSLLGSAEEDISLTDDVFELSAETDDLTFDIVEDEAVDLQLESALDSSFTGEVADSDAVIELNIDDNIDLNQPQNDDVDFSFDMAEEESETSTPVVEHNLQADLEEAEFYLQQGLYVEAEKLCQAILKYEPESAECRQKLEEIEGLLHREQEPSSGEPVAAATDLGAESFSDIDFNAGLDSLIPDEATEKKIFKTDVDEQIAADDLESHYNLGIAYREMGLLDDAISEFEKAGIEPSRYVDCQTLKGLSYSDKGDYENAELMFQQALDFAHLEAIQKLNLGYELGLLYERAERSNDALISYKNVFSQDSNYRDVRDKISILKKTLGITDDDSSDGPSGGNERISFL
ncbi:Tetratricopeptide repeat-containing protein [Desulfuromusa kysingii]|uniref:Tetratricopeptide repeat-containing protein n=1 Tax=Desulfuromusa kysingii TaxID=37625 RepID=A0A1H4CZ76_9BACT|nr:tetratricopeptide repeat protein [Desulfuromusa kysingii]SEA65795.1 Tetratricopeptide repeat-containing protein [Desulfuromusa kysingii]